VGLKSGLSTGDKVAGWVGGTAIPAAENLGIGAAKGAGNTLTGIQNAELKYIPGLRQAGLTPTLTPQQTATHGTAQTIGKLGEQAAEFLAPGPAEEAAAAKLAPYVGKAVPFLKAGLAALGSGTVNAAQGGDFSTGALAGGIGSGVSQGLQKIAPAVAESALNIRKLDRAYGKGEGAIGRAILDETTGLTPGAVAESAQGALNKLNPELNATADRASVRPNPARLALPAPAEGVPLGSPTVPEMPGDLLDAEKFPVRNVIPPPEASYVAGGIPQRDAFMSGAGEVLPPVGNQRVGPGMWMRQPEADLTPLPAQVPNPSASLNPALSALRGAAGTATRQGERTTLNQLEPMTQHLTQTVNGDAIPENITPRQLLDLKRGFGNEFIHRWNPETMQGVKGTAANVYHALGDEFVNSVPEAAALNARISRLIPVAKRAESAELNAPTTQRMFQRIGAPTGALTGTLGGGYEGYRHGGAEGAVAGALAGTLAPLLFTTPTGEMIMARTLNGASQPLTRLGVGAGLQLGRKNQ
jgi:hypothetical protein